MCRIPSFHQSWQFSSFLIPLSLFFSLFRLFLYNSNSLQLDSTSRRQEVRGQFRPAFFVLGVPVRYIHCPDSLSNVKFTLSPSWVVVQSLPDAKMVSFNHSFHPMSFPSSTSGLVIQS
ncbi:hypothetical protein BDV39DRAFT_186550 [Aspergillus sergii]|uniref:Uncharacterized protein n=1 Tax=Aspergillus sergii TaxID=1034303 RepID=A0A5N6WJN7_9EURO|nr:hypothetical protein BDV39DRAFT_186550 [Aspergillus sergii]